MTRFLMWANKNRAVIGAVVVGAGAIAALAMTHAPIHGAWFDWSGID